MKELNIAGNRILSYVIGEDELLPLKLRVNGYETFEELIKIKDVNYFRTPVNLTNPDSGPGYQYNPMDSDITKSYSDFIMPLISNYINENLNIIDCWYLYQTDQNWIDNPPHTHLTSDWVSVMYLDVKEGDSIEFYDAANNKEKYFPKFGEILFFPSSTSHKPSPNSGKKRLTINSELSRVRVDDEENIIRERYDICKSCDNYNAETYACSECSCYVPMKIGLINESCPIGKW